MTRDDDTPRNGVSLHDIHGLLVQQGSRLDRIDDRLLNHGERMGDIAARIGHVEDEMSMVRAAWVSHGKMIGELDATSRGRVAGCAARMKHLSEEIHRLGGSVEDVREDTGVLHLEDVRRKTIWWTLVKAAAALAALAGIAIGAVGAIQSCSTAREVKRDLKRAKAVRVKLVDQPWCLSELAEMRGVLERRLPHGEWMRLATGDVPWPRWR